MTPSILIDFYTDGAFSSKSEMGGGGVVAIRDEEKIFEASGYEPYSTNNRMEITAVLCALEKINTLIAGRTKVRIFTDSAYVEKTFNDRGYATGLKNGGRTSDRQPVKNQDLWGRVIALYIKLKAKFDIEIVRVKGHSDNRWNNYVDALAVQARQKLEV